MEYTHTNSKIVSNRKIKESAQKPIEKNFKRM